MTDKAILDIDYRFEHNGHDIVVAFRKSSDDESLDAYVGKVLATDKSRFDAVFVAGFQSDVSERFVADGNERQLIDERYLNFINDHIESNYGAFEGDGKWWEKVSAYFQRNYAFDSSAGFAHT